MRERRVWTTSTRWAIEPELQQPYEPVSELLKSQCLQYLTGKMMSHDVAKGGKCDMAKIIIPIGIA
jgi:hypothetical protein